MSNTLVVIPWNCRCDLAYISHFRETYIMLHWYCKVAPTAGTSATYDMSWNEPFTSFANKDEIKWSILSPICPMHPMLRHGSGLKCIVLLTVYCWRQSTFHLSNKIRLIQPLSNRARCFHNIAGIFVLLRKSLSCTIMIESEHFT